MPEEDTPDLQLVEEQMKSAIQRIRSNFAEQEANPEGPPIVDNNDAHKP